MFGFIHQALSLGDLNPRSVGNMYRGLAGAALKPLQKHLEAMRESVGNSKNRLKGIQGRGSLEAAKRSLGIQSSRNRLDNLKQSLAATGPVQSIGPGGPATATQVRQQRLQALITREEQKQQRLLRQDRSERAKIMGQVLSERTLLKGLEATEELVTKQVERREKAIAGTASKIEKVTETFTKLGHIGLGGLTTVTGALSGLLRAADPVGFGMFEVELKILSRSIGQMFIPLLREATEAVKNMSAWFDSLSPEVRQQVRDWTRLGLKVLAGLAAFALVGKAVSSIISVFGTVGSVIRGVVLAFQLIGPVGVAAFSGIVSAVRTAYTAMQALWALAVAHPFLAIATAIAAVTAAVLTMSGAFGGVGDRIKNAVDRIQELEALLEKYESGGKAKPKEIESLLRDSGHEEDYRKLVELADKPDEQMKYLQDMQKREQDRLKKMPSDTEVRQKYKPQIEHELGSGVSFLNFGIPGAKERSAELRSGLQERGVDIGGFNGVSSRETERYAKVRGGLMGRGMDEDQATKIALDIMAFLRAKGVANDAREVSRDLTKEAAEAAFKPRRESETILEMISRGIKEGGIKFEREKGGKEGGKTNTDTAPMMYAQKPELMDIASAWRKAQTSQQGDTPEMRERQDMLRRMARTNELLEKLDENTKHPPGLR